jgi:uncharacterized protein DUF5666
MLTRHRSFWIILLSLGLLTAFVFSPACKESTSSPTAPTAASMTGVVVSGDDMTGPQGSALAGVTVRVTRTGQSALTDGAGNFALSAVPSGDQEIEFSRADLNARGTVSIIGGTTMAVTVSIFRRSTVVVTPRGGGNAPGQTPIPHGNSVEQIEGLVTAVGGSTLTVLDDRLGTVIVSVTGTTTIRKGGTSLLLSQILVGMRVHVMALIETSGALTALEIIVQDENTKTVTPGVTGTPTATRTSTATPTPTHTP